MTRICWVAAMLFSAALCSASTFTVSTLATTPEGGVAHSCSESGDEVFLGCSSDYAGGAWGATASVHGPMPIDAGPFIASLYVWAYSHYYRPDFSFNGRASASVSMILDIVIFGPQDWGFLELDYWEISSAQGQSFTTNLPRVGDRYALSFGEPFQITASMSAGVSEGWYGGSMRLNAINVYDSNNVLLDRFTELPDEGGEYTIDPLNADIATVPEPSYTLALLAAFCTAVSRLRSRANQPIRQNNQRPSADAASQKTKIPRLYSRRAI